MFFLSPSLVDKARNFKWHVYDNDGSYNGWFDYLPLWMRVGWWSPVACAFLLAFYASVVVYKPTPLQFDIVGGGGDYDDENSNSNAANYYYYFDETFYVDVAIFAWCLFVMVRATASMGSIGAFYLSYTGWSWQLIMVRSFLDAVGKLLASFSSSSSNNDDNEGTTTAAAAAHAAAHAIRTIASSLRYPAVVASVVTFFVWNAVLLPLIYFVAMPREGGGGDGDVSVEGRRKKFMKFNCSFFMVNVHVLNLPLGLLNVVYSLPQLLSLLSVSVSTTETETTTSSNIRLFTPSDLWVSYVVVMLYSILYLFVLDRAGLHFYPMFCPRSALCAVSFGSVLLLYYALLHRTNDLILYLHPHLLNQ